MATRTATIIQTKHKGKDVYILDLGKTRVEKRYRNTRNAARGAVRANRDWCMKDPYDNLVKITYPDGRWRIGAFWTDGTIHLQELRAPKSTKTAKAK